MSADEELIMDWADSYLRHRDLIARRIREISAEKERLVITTKEDTKEYLIAMPLLSKVDSSMIREPTIIVTLNKKINLKTLTDRWDEFSKIKEISIIFINPGSVLEKKWIIRPYVHSRICDDASLKQGLKSIFDTVDEIL
jgi:hypothetical protein